MHAMFRIFAALFAVALLAAPARAELNVAVSILPQQQFVEEIAGIHAKVTVMVPPGADPHHYEPKPSQMAQLSTAQLYFAIGVPFEKAWLPRFHDAAKNLTIVDVSAGIHKLPIEGHHHHVEGHHTAHEGHHETLDPHVWLSPKNVRIIAQNILEALSKADPVNAERYHKNFTLFCKKIDALDAEFTELFAEIPGKNRAFMVFHPSWGYFANAYGLTQIPVEQQGREPSPKDLARLIRLAKEHGIKVVFVQPQFAQRSAAAIASGIDGKVVPADPLARDWFANMQTVGRAFHKALR